MKLKFALLLVPILLSGCLCCALQPIDSTPTPLPTVSYTSTPSDCGGSATFDITRNSGGASQNFRPNVRLEVGESCVVDQARIELTQVRTVSSVPFATFRYYYEGEFQQEVTSSAALRDLHELPGTTYGIRVIEVVPGTC